MDLDGLDRGPPEAPAAGARVELLRHAGDEQALGPRRERRRERGVVVAVAAAADEDDVAVDRPRAGDVLRAQQVERDVEGRVLGLADRRQLAQPGGRRGARRLEEHVRRARS